MHKNCYFKYIKQKFLSFFFAACGILGLHPGIKLVHPVLKLRRPNHWTLRGFPKVVKSGHVSFENYFHNGDDIYPWQNDILHENSISCYSAQFLHILLLWRRWWIIIILADRYVKLKKRLLLILLIFKQTLGDSGGQRNLAGYSPWGHKRVRHDLVTEQ